MKRLLLLTLLPFFAGLTSSASGPAARQPNILFIYLDDFGWKDTTFMGSDFYETPHLDRLAAKGMIFTDGYAPAANCAPSRASILSGQYTPRHEVFNVGTGPRGEVEHRRLLHVPGTNTLNADIATWAEVLQGAGYRTGMFGKWHVGLEPTDRGFDEGVIHGRIPGFNRHLGEDGDYLADRLTDLAIQFIRKSSDQPWCVYLSHFAVHTPIQGKPELVPKYLAKAPGELHRDPEMAAMIQAVDDAVGRLMVELADLGMLDNTVIFFSSDNGGYGPVTSMHPLKGYKGTYYEGGIRVPFFVTWPGVIAPGSQSGEPVHGVDLFPTFCEIASIPLPEGQALDGVSLLPLLRGEVDSLSDPGKPPRPLFWHFPAYLESYNVYNEQRDPLFRSRPCSIIRMGDWKLHQYFEDGGLELYNLREDIGEQVDLSDTHPEKAKELLTELERWQSWIGAPIPTERNPAFDPEAEAEAILKAEAQVLPEDFNSDLTQQMMRAYLRDKSHEAFDQRLEELEAALQSPGKIPAYQARRAGFLRGVLDHFERDTPLNPRVTGRLSRDGVIVEKILFESQPGFYVTGNLYLPDQPGPHPAVLQPCGHSAIGKAAIPYQQASLQLARNGFVVLCYDPIGQGERSQLVNEAGEPLRQTVSEHLATGEAPILLGRSLGSYMVHDAVRAIDYLQSRPEVDPQRIGCTGNSGGGNLTSFLMAYDERIAAAAPGCFMTTLRLKHESPGPGDSEQNHFAQIREGFDLPDYILTRAPKPTLILSATYDYVPIEGSWTAFRQAKRLYTQLGHPERVDLVEAPERHGFSQRLREGSVRFMARWLQDRTLEGFDSEELPVFSEEELRSTPEGQVMRVEGARNIIDLNREEADRQLKRREEINPEGIRAVTGIRELADLPEPPVQQVDARRIKLFPEPGIVLPAHFWPGGDQAPVLLFPDKGMASAFEEALRLHHQGHPVLLMDLRDLGETATNNWRFEPADAYIAYMLGTSFLAMRAEDILKVARYVAATNGRDAVRIIAHGKAGPAALHATALEPGLFSHLDLIGSLPSWRSLIDREGPVFELQNIVHGAYAHYDLPDLVRLARHRGVLINKD